MAYENSVVPNISPLNAKDDVELGTVLMKEKQIYTVEFDCGLNCFTCLIFEKAIDFLPALTLIS